MYESYIAFEILQVVNLVSEDRILNHKYIFYL